MKLELKHIAPYLPREVKGKHRMTNEIETITGLNSGVVMICHDTRGWCDFIELQLVLRPLSDLTKEIEHNGEKFVPCNLLFYCDEFDKFMGCHSVDFANDFINSSDRLKLCYDFDFWQKLFEWHFDVFGLIEKGLAVNFNDVKQ